MGRKIKSPTELFEEKRLATLKSLEELKQQKIEEEQNKLLNRRVKSPKEVFGVKEEAPQNTDEIKEIIEEKKEVVVESPLRFITKYYDNEIENLKNNLVELKDSIPVVEKFDSTDLYNHIKSLKELIGKVKEDIPEQILYDDQLKALTDSIDSVRKSIPEVPEVKYYDEEIENIINIINDVRNEIPVVPEIRYYDEQILNLENALNSFPDIKYYDKDIIELQERIEEVRTEIENLPEVKYYDEQIQEIENRISIVKNEIPEVPEVKYYDEQIAELEDKISNIQIPEVKYYDEQIKELQDKIDVVKDNIPEVPKVKYYDEQITELEDKISNIQIPEVKYYDFEIENVLQEVQILKEAVVSFKINETKKVQDLYDSFESKTKNISKKISHIEEVFEKFNEKEILNEGLLNEPPEVKNEDPLTPLDKNFVTLDQLQNHYRLFINRVQQQLATIGGGGETRLEFLDDVDRDSAKQDGYVLQYSSVTGKFIGTSYVPGGGGTGSGGTSYWVGTNAGIYTTGNVAIGTNVVSSGSTALWVQGDVRITGILSIGQGTVTIDGNNNTISVGTGVTISQSGSANYAGVITASSFVGDGSGLTNLQYTTSSGIATYATTAGIATYATSSGIATYASTAGIATYATSSGIATYATSSGIATYATSAGTATTATKLETARTFQITGDVVSSPVSFDGTGNVSFAATIQPNSVALGGDTTGDYVQSVSGTSNQIAVTGGTGEGSTPVISIATNPTLSGNVTITNDLQVNNNLNVTGNITIGGTSAYIVANDFRVKDADIVAGFTTDSNGNDASKIGRAHV